MAAALFTGGFLALLNGIVSGPQDGWLSPWVLGSLAAAGLLLTAWARRELRSRGRCWTCGSSPGPRSGRGGRDGGAVPGDVRAVLPQRAVPPVREGYGPFGAGVRLLPMAAALLAGPRCGLVLERWCGRRGAVAAGMLVLAAGLATVSAADARTPYALYAVGAGLTALGCGTATPLLSHAMMSALPPEVAGVGSGLQSLTRELGSALGIAVTGTLTAAVFAARLPAPLAGPGGRRRSRRPRPRSATCRAAAPSCGPRWSPPSPGAARGDAGVGGGVALAAGAIYRWMPEAERVAAAEAHT
ncbi:hypothetical protein O1L55_27920 [Streptomyces albulus]|nr:hypothetical protein [Streptomyces noursei]